MVLFGLWTNPEYGEQCVTLTGTSWTQVTAPLDTHVSVHTVLRAQLYMETAGVNFDVDGTQLVGAGLTSASFGGGAHVGLRRSRPSQLGRLQQWLRPMMGPITWNMNTGSLPARAASVWQDVPLSTQPGQSFDFSVWLRSATGTPGEVCVVLFGLWTNPEYGEQCVTLTGTSWTQVTAPLDTHVYSSHRTESPAVHGDRRRQLRRRTATQLVGAGLTSASFGGGAMSGWALTPGATLGRLQQRYGAMMGPITWR